MSKTYGQNYRFDNDDEILNLFSKRQNTKYYRVKYLLNKLKENRDIPVDL